MYRKNVTAIRTEALAVIETLEARSVDSEFADIALITATAVVAADLSNSERELGQRLQDLQSILTACAKERFRAQPPVTHAMM
jgi:hypothetical protein